MTVRFTSKRATFGLRVRYADTDKAAVVHHAAYLAYLESARIEYFRTHGFDYARFEAETGIGMPVVEFQLKYRAPARFDEELEVETFVDKASRFTVWIAGTVRRGEAVLIESRVRLACVHMVSESPTRMPRALFDACLEVGWEI